MNVQFESLGQQHGYLNLTIQQSDYAPFVEEELKKLRKKANIKGFRPGAAPEAMIRKLYGEELKNDQIHKLVNKAIEDYQKTEDLHFLGDLIPVGGVENEKTDEDIRFKFEVGIAPKAELQNFLSKVQVQRYQVEIPEARIDEEIEHLRNRFGDQIESGEPIALEDFVELEALELEGGELKEGGWKTQFPVLLNDKIHPSFSEKLLGKKKDHGFDFNIREVELDLSEEHLEKYLLKIPEGESGLIKPGNEFRGQIVKVLRRKPAEITEELFKKAFGPETPIKSESDLRSELRKNLENYFEAECKKLVDIELVQNIVKHSGMFFPDTFLVKWLQASYKEWAEKSGHELEHALYHFKEGMVWRLVRDKIAQEQQLNVTYDELIEAVIEDLKMQYQGFQLPDEAWKDLAKRGLDNQEKAMHYYVEAQNKKALAWLTGQIELKEEVISLDDFREKVRKINEHNH